MHHTGPWGILLFISHGLVVGGANYYDAPTDLRLPDLG